MCPHRIWIKTEPVSRLEKHFYHVISDCAEAVSVNVAIKVPGSIAQVDKVTDKYSAWWNNLINEDKVADKRQQWMFWTNRALAPVVQGNCKILEFVVRKVHQSLYKAEHNPKEFYASCWIPYLDCWSCEFPDDQ